MHLSADKVKRGMSPNKTPRGNLSNVKIWKDALNSLSMHPGDAPHFTHEKQYIVNIKQLVFNHSNWQKKPCC